MKIDLTSAQVTKLSDLICAAEECWRKGKLYTCALSEDGQDLVLLPAGLWNRLCNTSKAWEEEKNKIIQRDNRG